ncbi:MAG TPA: glycosyltransferase [Bacteroidetes bacterium]|nr:glycosyltransferase [Bacteroidota bacterium]
MKIIHVVLGKANPERMNGVNKVAYQLARTQHGLGHDASVWGIANSLEHNYPPRPFKTRLFLQSPRKYRLGADLPAALREVPAGTVFHLHGAFIPEFFLLSKQMRKRGLPYVYTPHGSLTKAAMQQSKWRKKIYFNLFEKPLIRHARAVQLLGDQEYSFLDRLVKIEHKVLIPNGMDLSELPKDLDHQPNPVPVFNFCGRLDAYHKGLDLMLEGFALFLKNGRQARLELIGDGKDRAALEQQAKDLGIEKSVVFYGAKYGDEKYRLMARGDVFLHTSRMEGFPMAVLEAAALNRPCLTSEPTNINRFIRQYEAGIPLNEHHNPSTICQGMEKAFYFFKNNQLTQLGNNAGKMVSQAFNWKNISRQLVRVYAG